MITNQSTQPVILINPPSGPYCDCCQRNFDELPDWDFHGKTIKILKSFRDEGQGTIGATWTCRLCLSIPNVVYWRLWRTPKEIRFADYLQKHDLTEESVTLKHILQYRKECWTIYEEKHDDYVVLSRPAVR